MCLFVLGSFSGLIFISNYLHLGTDSAGGDTAVEKEEGSTKQGSVFSFMNVAPDTHEENIAMENDSKEGKSQSAFSFLQVPSEGQKDQEEEDVDLSAAKGDMDAEKQEGALNGDSASVGEPSGSAFSFLRTAASEEKLNQAVPSLLLSFEGTDTSQRSATLSEPDAGSKGKGPAPTSGQPHVSSPLVATPTTTPPKTAGRGLSMRNIFGFGRNTKKQNAASTETPELISHGPSNPPPPSITSEGSVQDLATSSATEAPVEPIREGGRDEVPRPSQQEGGEKSQGGATPLQATPLPATLSALLMGHGMPTTTPSVATTATPITTPSTTLTATPTTAFTSKKWTLPPKGSSAALVSTPAIAMETPDKAAPSQQSLTSTKLAVAPPTTAKVSSSVGRQLPPAGKKKKKRALRPGQGWEEEDAGSQEGGGGGNKEPDTHSLGSESSTNEGRGEGREATELLDEVASEVAGSSQLVEVMPITMETVQATPLVETGDQQSRALDMGQGGEGEEVVRAVQKKETIPSGLRAAYQLDKVTTVPTISVLIGGEECVRGTGSDHHSRGLSSEVPPRGKATLNGSKGGLTGAEKLTAALQSSEGELSKIR